MNLKKSKKNSIFPTQQKHVDNDDDDAADANP